MTCAMTDHVTSSWFPLTMSSFSFPLLSPRCVEAILVEH